MSPALRPTNISRLQRFRPSPGRYNLVSRARCNAPALAQSQWRGSNMANRSGSFVRQRELTPCRACGTPTLGYRGYFDFCSTRCQTEHRRYPNGRPMQLSCAKCDGVIDLSAVGPAGRKTRSDRMLCRKCRRNQAYPLTVHEIAERDGTACSICMAPVDMTLVWPDRMAPTREHVIPVTKGGTNEATNLALAHFSCNVKKGNRVTVSA